MTTTPTPDQLAEAIEHAESVVRNEGPYEEWAASRIFGRHLEALIAAAREVTDLRARLDDYEQAIENMADNMREAWAQAADVALKLSETEKQLDAAQLLSIEARNPGIDMDEVRVHRATGIVPTRLGGPATPPPTGYGACRTWRGNRQTSHLVVANERGFVGGTLCGLTRFDAYDPETHEITRPADLPGWSMNGGTEGPDVWQVDCPACWLAHLGAVKVDGPNLEDPAPTSSPVDLCHNGHPFEPGMNCDGNPPDPTWCDACGETRRG